MHPREQETSQLYSSQSFTNTPHTGNLAMRNWIRFCWVVLLLNTSLQAKADGPLMFITEAYPPYNFSDDNILRGIAVDLLVIASLNRSEKHTSELQSQSNLVFRLPLEKT